MQVLSSLLLAIVFPFAFYDINSNEHFEVATKTQIAVHECKCLLVVEKKQQSGEHSKFEGNYESIHQYIIDENTKAVPEALQAFISSLWLENCEKLKLKIKGTQANLILQNGSALEVTVPDDKHKGEAKYQLRLSYYYKDYKAYDTINTYDPNIHYKNVIAGRADFVCFLTQEEKNLLEEKFSSATYKFLKTHSISDSIGGFVNYYKAKTKVGYVWFMHQLQKKSNERNDIYFIERNFIIESDRHFNIVQHTQVPQIK